MTQEKDFKRLVRARMEKTGESYTSARAQLRSATVSQETAPGGRTAETASLARALAALGVLDPRTGKPLSEALIFGVGGGIGLAYFVFEYSVGGGASWITLYLGGRINPYVQRATPGTSKDAEWMDVACRRLGIPHEVHQSASPAAAEKRLKAALAAKRPAIALVDEVMLPHGLPKEYAGMSPAPVLVTLAGDEPALFGLAPRPYPSSWPELARLRAAVKSAKHGLRVLDRPAQPVDLAAAVRAGIAETCRGMLAPPMKNFGLPGLAKWAALVTDPRDKKGWPTLFRQGERLGQALKWVAHWVVGPGSDGSFLRTLYADFLLEAADLLGRPALATVAGAYRALAAQWVELAEAILPRAIPQLEPICSLLELRRCLLERHDAMAAVELQEIEDNLRGLDQQLVKQPIAPAEAQALLGELHTRILHLHEGETHAVEALARAAGVAGGPQC